MPTDDDDDEVILIGRIRRAASTARNWLAACWRRMTGWL
jgi:hypothetical protein